MNKPLNTKRSIWIDPQKSEVVYIIDQRHLPHKTIIAELKSVTQTARVIKEMWVRGAPLIGATAGYGMYFAALEARNQTNPILHIQHSAEQLRNTRPTAVDLHWAIDRQLAAMQKTSNEGERIEIAFNTARQIVEESVDSCRRIGEHGLAFIKSISQKKAGEVVNILTHCNAGRMACVEWGTATSPIYQAHEAGIPVHVYVDETRPRNQGARITAWELKEANIPYTVIVDNVGGHLMQHGMVDMCIVGSDRTTRNGDVANKIGTYLKALAADANDIPFYVALPSSTIDWQLAQGVDIPIEERHAAEVTHIYGWSEELNDMIKVRLTPAQTAAKNYGFDVTPAALVSALITERGCCEASEEGLLGLFPERH